MINTVVEQLIQDVLGFFAERNINFTPAYTPELDGLERYFRDFYQSTLSSPPNAIDGSLYQDKLLYNIGTPKLNPDRFRNFNLQAVIKNDAAAAQDTSTTVYTDKDPAGPFGAFTKTRIETVAGSGNVLVRDISLLEVPINFMLITEDNNLVFDSVLLIYQKLRFLSELDISISLDPTNPTTLTDLSYLIQWDIDEIEVAYANLLQNKTAQNTLSFGLKILGGFFSNFYTETGITNTINIRIGAIGDQGKTN